LSHRRPHVEKLNSQLYCFKNIISIPEDHDGDDDQEKYTDKAVSFFERHPASDNASRDIEYAIKTAITRR